MFRGVVVLSWWFWRLAGLVVLWRLRWGVCEGLAPCMRRESERGRNPSQVAGYGPPAFRIIISYRESEPASGATDEGRGGGTPYNACYTARAPAPAAPECALGKTRGAWEPTTMMVV